MTTHVAVASLNSVSMGKQHDSAETDELKSAGLRQRIEVLLHKIFEGHEEFLGCTPD